MNNYEKVERIIDLTAKGKIPWELKGSASGSWSWYEGSYKGIKIKLGSGTSERITVGRLDMAINPNQAQRLQKAIGKIFSTQKNKAIEAEDRKVSDILRR